ncbi:MAG: hypothetical protein ACFFCS_20800 [Candidatus Hodarchaeota archaeon]
MARYKYTSYTCQSCGRRASIPGWDQSKIPKCPSCHRATCTKCGAADFCEYCVPFLEPGDARKLKSWAWHAKMNPVKYCLFCITCPGSVGSLILLVFSAILGISAFIACVVIMIAMGIQEKVMQYRIKVFQNKLVDGVHAKMGLHETAPAYGSNVQVSAPEFGLNFADAGGRKCPRCGRVGIETFVIERATGRRVWACGGCNILY